MSLIVNWISKCFSMFTGLLISKVNDAPIPEQLKQDMNASIIANKPELLLKQLSDPSVPNAIRKDLVAYLVEVTGKHYEIDDLCASVALDTHCHDINNSIQLDLEGHICEDPEAIEAEDDVRFKALIDESLRSADITLKDVEAFIDSIQPRGTKVHIYYGPENAKQYDGWEY